MSMKMSHSDENIIAQLKQSVHMIVEKTGPHSQFAKDLIDKIGALQKKLDALTDPEKHTFIQEMKGSFKQTIESIEKKLTQHAYFEQTYSTSIAVALIFIVLSVFALFGYKLYKSLTEKELRRQEKLKGKQQKKTKKSN